MKHIFIEGNNKNAPTLLLLHGTGGDEHDLLSIGKAIAPDSSILSVRGNVLENGMPRFFRRLAEGIFDEEDLIIRTKELNSFVNDSAETYQFDRGQVIAIGYSNGANIAASMMYHYEQALHGAILFHAMVPLRGVDLPDLTNRKVFIGAGKHDPLIPLKETEKLVEDLKAVNATVTEFWVDGGHALVHEEVERARDWFMKNY